MLNYIHTSDDVNDFLREIGILLDWDEMIQALEAMVSDRVISYPSIIEPTCPEYDYTLDRWLNNICSKMERYTVPDSALKYIMDNIKILRKCTEQKFTLEFISALYKYNLVEWDYETIVVLSNHISYQK